MLSAQFQVAHGVSLDEAPPSVSRVNFGFRMLGEDCFHFPSSSYICSPLFQASPLLLNLSLPPPQQTGTARAQREKSISQVSTKKWLSSQIYTEPVLPRAWVEAGGEGAVVLVPASCEWRQGREKEQVSFSPCRSGDTWTRGSRTKQGSLEEPAWPGEQWSKRPERPLPG